MTRGQRGCIAIHEDCGALEHSPGTGITWADAMAAWGRERQRSLGYKVPEPMPQFFGRAA